MKNEKKVSKELEQEISQLQIADLILTSSKLDIPKLSKIAIALLNNEQVKDYLELKRQTKKIIPSGVC